MSADAFLRLPSFAAHLALHRDWHSATRAVNDAATAGVAGRQLDTDGVSAAALAPGAAGAGLYLVDTVSVSAAPLAKT